MPVNRFSVPMARAVASEAGAATTRCGGPTAIASNPLRAPLAAGRPKVENHDGAADGDQGSNTSRQEMTRAGTEVWGRSVLGVGSFPRRSEIPLEVRPAVGLVT